MKSPNSLFHIYGCKNLCYSTLVICLTFFTFSFSLFSQQLAFPSVEGGGSYVTGGRGGIVVKVTNLNNSGPGSFREAMLMTVPRIIVFDVSGTITLNSHIELRLNNSNFTVAGQTAPEGGITITNDFIRLGGGWSYPQSACNNGIFRYIRFRNARYTGESDNPRHNAVTVVGSEGLIFDHCSFSFNDDQALNMDSKYGDLVDVTVQNCMFSENATAIIAGLQGNYQRGNMTFINNLFVDQSHRTPNVGGNLQFDIINNVCFNWVSRLVNANNGSPDINYIGNYLKEGSYTSDGHTNQVQNIIPSIYTANNYHPEYYPTPELDDRDMWQLFVNSGAVPSSRFTTTMHPLLGNVEVSSAQDAYTNVINDVGTNKYLNADGSFGTYLDSYDALKISNVQNNISSDPYNKNWTLPSLPTNTRPASYDTDDDGMADEWEMNTFGDLSHTGSEDSDGNGYTDIEEFINGVDSQSTSGIVANAGNDVSICEGESTTLTASGGATYLWNTGATTASIDVNPTTTTTYTVTVFDVTGTNSDTDDVTVTVNAIPTADAGNDVETCIGTAVTLTATGGTSYLWNTGATTQSISVNPNVTTTYSVEVTQNSCSSTDDVQVTVNPLPSVDAGLDVTINLGESTTLTASGATSYTWNTGATTASIDVNPTTTTTYTVTGLLNGCENTDTVIVTVIDTSVTANAGNDVSICEGESTTLTASGGATYLWNTGATTASIDVNPTATTTYTVTVFDVTGTNSDTDDVTVTVNAIPTADAGNDVETCIGTAVTLTATGGTSYLWNTGATTQSISVNPNVTTTYSVEVTQNSCSSTDDVQVTVNPLPSVDAGLDVTINLGESTTLTASGATSYTWNTGATTASIDVNPTTTTTYTVTGLLNGCENTDTVIVTVIDTSVTANAGNDVSICEGESTTLTASGGVTYLWNTGATTASIDVNPTATTTYTVTVFDVTGTNSDTDDVTVTVNAIPTADAGNDVETCIGTAVTLTATGGTSYLWNTGATTQSISVNPNVTTTYSVEVTQNSCSSTDDVQVTVNPLPSVDAGLDVTINLGESTTLTASGATSYTWNTGATTASIDVNPTTTTTYTVTGLLNGCENTDTVIVTVLDEGVTAEAGDDVVVCQGYETTLTASGGDSYLWSTGETTQSIVVSPSSTSTYSVTVFDATGTNSDTDDVTVSVNPNPNVVILNGDDVTILEGEYVTLSVTGANTYEWNNGATQPNIAVNPSVTTTYTVIGYINDCSDAKQVSVNVVEQVIAYAGEDQEICLGESVTLTATGGDEYLWNTGDTTQSITVSPEESSDYSVTVYNALDYDDATVTITVVDCSVVEETPEDPTGFEFLIYPNPASDILNVEVSGFQNLSGIYMYDMAGKKVYIEDFENVNELIVTRELNVSNFSRGIYLLKLLYDDKVITKRIVLSQ